MHTGQNWHQSRIQSREIWSHLTLFSLAGFWIMQGSSFDLCCKLPIRRTQYFQRTYLSQFFFLITSLVILQFLCALTLPMGKIVVDYVKENHNVSIPSQPKFHAFYSHFSCFPPCKACSSSLIFSPDYRITTRFSWQNIIVCGCMLCLGLHQLLDCGQPELEIKHGLCWNLNFIGLRKISNQG